MATEDYLIGLAGDERIIAEARKRFAMCEEWERTTRIKGDEDFKFANGDSDNNWQWDDNVIQQRDKKPCLTMNKVRIHNNQIVNDAKQNKPGVNIRPVGDSASYEAAQVYQDIVRHIEYQSSAENVYDTATEQQVYRGIGYWRVLTKYASNDTFDQDIYIVPVNNPNSVYLDPDIKQKDGSDARYGFVYEDVPRDLFISEYPKFKNVAPIPTLGNSNVTDMWLTKDHVRVCEYYRRKQSKDKFVFFVDPVTQQSIETKWSDLSPEGRETFKSVKEQSPDGVKERDILTDAIEWYKFAGDKIIDRSLWAGETVPIVRVVGIETIINGSLDRRGHTRWMKDAQRMYNYATSNSVEVLTTQTKSPWLVPVAGIENLEKYWSGANVNNAAVLAYNHMAEDGNAIPPPAKIMPPQISTGYVQEMQIAQNEMMMVSGQYQSQLGENENAKSGVAINARQRQGDNATYHFIDNLAIAIRYTGKILIDLIPKIYDTPRVLRIMSLDGTKTNVQLDPNAEEAVQRIPPQPGHSQEMQDRDSKAVEMIFNPNVGRYDVLSDTGPSYATRRQEAWNAMVQIMQQNKELMGVAGDLLFKVADFPEALQLSERLRRTIPPNIIGDAPDPKVEEAMHMAAQKVEELQTMLKDEVQKVKEKDQQLDLDSKKVEMESNLKAYDAETRRLVALGNSGPSITPAQIQPIIKRLLAEMLGDTPDNAEKNDGQNAAPPDEGARQAPDGNYYVGDPDRPGKYLMLNPTAMGGSGNGGMGANAG